MYARILLLIVSLSLIGAALLELRQRRIDVTFQIASLQAQIDQVRYRTWDLQALVARQLNPRSLHRSITNARLDLEPVHASPRSQQQTRLTLLKNPVSY